MVSNVIARRRGASMLPSTGALAEDYERTPAKNMLICWDR